VASILRMGGEGAGRGEGRGVGEGGRAGGCICEEKRNNLVASMSLVR
jgi:hypothetical protein